MNLLMILLNTESGYGFHAIDESLQGLIQALGQFPEDTFLGTIMGWARIIGLCLALGVGSYECYMMILGRKGMDVMKLLRIVIISMCITSSSWIADAAAAPGKALGDEARASAMNENQAVKALEDSVALMQKAYLLQIDHLITTGKMQEIADEQQSQDKNWLEQQIDEMQDNMRFRIQKMAITAETKICEWLSILIRFIGEVIFQIAYYGILLAQNLFMHILRLFCPIAFALSLAPPFKSAWSQWLSKYLSLSLWAFITYLILFYVSFVMEYNLKMDLQHYSSLLDNVSQEGLDWQKVGTIGMQGLGSTCMYVVGLLVGVFLLKFVPEVSSWLIPGGVSSGVGGAASGLATGAAGMAGGVVGGAIGASMGAAPFAASEMKSIGNDAQSVLSHIGRQAQDNLNAVNIDNMSAKL